MDALEVEKQKQLADIENDRFRQMVTSLGADTLKDIARAGPELQVCPTPPPPSLTGHAPSRFVLASDWLCVLLR